MGKQDLPAGVLTSELATQDEGTKTIALLQTTLDHFKEVEASLPELHTKYHNVAFAVSTVIGMADAKAARVAIREPRYAVDKFAKAAKVPLNELKKNIDARALTITNALVDLETPIHEQIKAEEDRVTVAKEAEKAAKIAAAARAQTAIDGIRCIAVNAATGTASEIDMMRAELDAMEITVDEFGDRSGEALQTKMQVLDTLDTLHSSAMAREESDARAASDRAELEAMRAEQVERERKATEEREAAQAIETARRAEETRAAEQKLAEERAAFAQEQEQARAVQLAAADRLAAERADLDRARQAEQDRQAEERATADAARQAEQRQQEEAAAIERRAIEARAQAERDEEARIEREAAAAEQRRLNEEAKARRAEEDRIAAEIRAATEAAHQADQRGRDGWQALLAALKGMVNEEQPLGIGRATYQAGLAAIATVEGA